jgi:3D (Asp-Asp-Asp) domain-containing protein
MKLKIASGVAAAVVLSGVTAVVLLLGQAPPGQETLNALSVPQIRLPPTTSAPATTTTTPSSTTPTTPASTSSSSKPPTTTTKTTTSKPSTVKPASPNASGTITFYAAKDNDPPGSRSIAFPGILHSQAGGSGTFSDPLTFAAAEGVFKPGTKVYVPDVQRYFILEDICATCSGSHIDLWAGAADDNGVLSCEEALTRNGARPYEVNPPAGRPVVAGALYRSGQCFQS